MKPTRSDKDNGVKDPTQSPIEQPKPPDEPVADYPRMGNGQLVSFKTLTIRRTLTKPLISVAYTEDIVVRLESELYERELPLAGRSDKPAPATLVDVTLFTPVGEGQYETSEAILICNAMIKGAFERSGGSLTGRTFFIHGDVARGDKRYRHCDVQELNTEVVPA